MSKPKLLITGSGGFIMSNFIRKAIYDNCPYTLVSVDNIEKTSVMNNIYSNKNHQFYIGDVSNYHFLNIIFELERPDIVLHGAAETSSPGSSIDYNKYIDSNIRSTQTIIELCAKWNVGKLIYTSTDKVYGEPIGSSNKPIESGAIFPSNIYASTKAAAEMLIASAGRSQNLKYNILRSCNNFGPRQTSNKFIPLIIKNIMDNVPTKIYGKGQQLREWLHVQDNCSAILDVIIKGADNQIYNVTANYEYSNIEVFNEIANILGKGHDLIEFDDSATYHEQRYSSSADKLRAIGWKPSFKPKDGLKHTVAWYVNNPYYLKL